jgi:ubiquinone/menaquinone biosynthesis C-methylase UbiE
VIDREPVVRALAIFCGHVAQAGGPIGTVNVISPNLEQLTLAVPRPNTRAHFELGDAQALKFKDAAFDSTLALFVMNFVPAPNKAIAEMRRVTRP